MTPTEVKAYAKALSDKIGNSVPEPSDWDLLLKAVQGMETAPLKLPSYRDLMGDFERKTQPVEHRYTVKGEGDPSLHTKSVTEHLGTRTGDMVIRMQADGSSTCEKPDLNALRQRANGGHR